MSIMDSDSTDNHASAPVPQLHVIPAQAAVPLGVNGKGRVVVVHTHRTLGSYLLLLVSEEDRVFRPSLTPIDPWLRSDSYPLP